MGVHRKENLLPPWRGWEQAWEQGRSYAGQSYWVIRDEGADLDTEKRADVGAVMDMDADTGIGVEEVQVRMRTRGGEGGRAGADADADTERGRHVWALGLPCARRIIPKSWATAVLWSKTPSATMGRASPTGRDVPSSKETREAALRLAIQSAASSEEERSSTTRRV